MNGDADRLDAVRRARKWVSTWPIVRYIRGRKSILGFRRRYKSFLSDPRRFTDQGAQLALRQAFLASRGTCLDWAWRLQKERTPVADRPLLSTLFPALDESVVEKATESLRNDGFYVMPWTISGDFADAIVKKALGLDVTGVDPEDDIQKAGSIRSKQPVYYHRPQELAAIPQIRQLVVDPGIWRIAARYLECEPVVDTISAWWTFPVNGAANVDPAQIYHYDLDRVRWLKVFVYLTDVDEFSGPHVYVRGSHRTIGRKISRDDRYSDGEVFSMYPREDEVVFIAPRGTVIFEDTLGFHKGIPAISKHRFILELELSINHFGYPYDDLGLPTASKEVTEGAPGDP